MAINTSATPRLDRAAWLTLTLTLLFTLFALGSTLAILSLPTDGWQIVYDSPSPPSLANFAGDWPTPLRANDQVLAVGGITVYTESFSPSRSHPPGWQDGGTVTYTILRDGRQMAVDVTLHRLDLAGILRSLWFTMQVTPIEWSWSIIAILVFLLRPHIPAARLMFLTFISYNAVTKLSWAATIISHNFAPAPAFYIHSIVNFFWGYLFFPAIILLALSFPQPIFPLTRWPRAFPILLFGLSLTVSLLALFFKIEQLATVILIADAVLLILAFGAALFNTRKLSQNPIARAQSLWVGFGFALCFIPLLVGYLLDYSGLVDLDFLSGFYNYFVILVLPLSLAIAITRYRLFDIDVIIRRTLLYTFLTLILSVVYFGIVVILQTILSASTGQGQEITIVLSTLAIAALFTPLRRRVQDFIDHRFFRSKYNAEQVLTAFSATTREEVALEPLSAALLQAVNETLQPETMSLWLKSGSKP